MYTHLILSVFFSLVEGEDRGKWELGEKSALFLSHLTVVSSPREYRCVSLCSLVSWGRKNGMSVNIFFHILGAKEPSKRSRVPGQPQGPSGVLIWFLAGRGAAVIKKTCSSALSLNHTHSVYCNKCTTVACGVDATHDIISSGVLVALMLLT